MDDKLLLLWKTDQDFTTVFMTESDRTAPSPIHSPPRERKSSTTGCARNAGTENQYDGWCQRCRRNKAYVQQPLIQNWCHFAVFIKLAHRLTIGQIQTHITHAWTSQSCMRGCMLPLFIVLFGHNLYHTHVKRNAVLSCLHIIYV